MMKKWVVIAGLMLAGCHSSQPAAMTTKDMDKQIDDLFAAMNQPEKPSVSSYAGKIKLAVEQQLSNPGQWKGKECTVQIEVQRNGVISQASAEKGDKDFCNAAVAAIKKAKIPPAPSDEIYKPFKNASLTFKF